jgi:hypothetical protein
VYRAWDVKETHTSYWSYIRKERDCLKGLGVNERITLKLILTEIRCGDVD